MDAHNIPLTFGLLLAAALCGGLLADWLRVPKVTAYLVVGVALGPNALDCLDRADLHVLHPLTELAMALVLFNLGCHFPMAYLRRIGRRALRLAAGDVGLTFLFVFCGLIALGYGWETGLLLGVLAMATAPATTVLVLQETESEGPVTEFAEAMVVANNLAAIVAFELAFLAVVLLEGAGASAVVEQLGGLARDVGAALAAGVAAGAAASYGCAVLHPGRWFVFLIALVSLLLGAAAWLQLPYMLCFLAMGLTVANLSAQAKELVAKLSGLTLFLCVAFFALHGAELRLDQLRAAGGLGAAYIVLRLLGKCLGPYSAARAGDEPPMVRRWLGPALVAQAGAAIALAHVAVQRSPELGGRIQTVILGTVVFFELVGPLMIRQAVLRAGEVPLFRAVRHVSGSPWGELRRLWLRLLLAVGRSPAPGGDPSRLRVEDLVRRSIRALDESASFEEVISLIEHTRDDTYPVVDEQRRLVGVVRYYEISHVLFDREASTLIRAADLASPARRVLYPDQSAAEALRLFRGSRDDGIPVVSRDPPGRLIGMVRRRDMVGYLSRRAEPAASAANAASD